MENIEAVIAKVQKLLALSNSSNEHEAANAAAQARKLMDRYKLDMAQLEAAGEAVAVDPIEFGAVGLENRHSTWRGYLAVGVAKLNGCHSVLWHVMANGRKATETRMFGRRGDVAAAKYMYEYLVREVESLTDQAWAEASHGSAEHGKSWKNSFRLGCASRLYNRLVELAADRDKAFKAEAQETALAVIRKNDLEVTNGWAKFHAQNKLRKTTAYTSNRSRDGYSAGREAGDRVNLNGGRAALGAAPGKLQGV